MNGRFALGRPAALLAVALLHVALVIALMAYSNEKIARPPQVPREITLRFEPLPVPPARRARESRPRTERPGGPTQPFPDYRGITLPGGGPAASPTLRQALFGCSDKELSDLSPADRAKCANAFAHDDSVDIRDGTQRSRAAALWERDRQRKNAPFLLPCMSPQGFSPLYTALCAAKSVLDGKADVRDQLGYQDLPDHVENEGDTRMAPVPH